MIRNKNPMIHDTEALIISNAGKYPLSEPQDFVKLLYQSCFGCGHMISDKESAVRRIKSEYQSMGDIDKSASTDEKIGGGFSRASLAALKEDQLSALGSIFFASARKSANGINLFTEALDILKRLASESRLNSCFGASELNEYLSAYIKSGYPAVSHSERYRNAYNPHYRVVRSDMLAIFDIVCAVGKCLDTKKTPVISIDGRCGSGKSTIASLLADIFNITVLKVDDFFLTPQMRTEERLSQPGGNLDRERLEKEILVPFLKAAADSGDSSEKTISYRPYVCSVRDFGEKIQLPANRPLLVEGSYSQHPELAKYYDLRIFINCSEEVQFSRISEREGIEKTEIFKSKWIPLEEKYFSSFNIMQNADLVFDSSGSY